MQQSLSDFVAAMEKAGLLVRIKEEMRVDQIPKLMEANPTKAVLVEKVKDTRILVPGQRLFEPGHVRVGDGLRQDARPAVEMVERGQGPHQMGDRRHRALQGSHPEG